MSRGLACSTDPSFTELWVRAFGPLGAAAIGLAAWTRRQPAIPESRARRRR
jgi:hypothetical protein